MQPLIAGYRVEVVEALNQLFNLKIFACTQGVEARGFSSERPPCDEFVETSIAQIGSPGIKIQSKVVAHLVRERPDAVLIFADIRFLSLWLTLIAGRVMHVPVLIHGQGLYRHQHAGWLRTLCYRLAVSLASRYVCYTDASRHSLEAIGCPDRKLVVADNSLTVLRPVTASEKTGTENGVLFLGRLRDDSDVDMLIDAIGVLRREGGEGRDILLHVVGDGEHGERLRQRYAGCDYIVWYGAVFDDRKIASISRQCRIGCYPGAAGLSVVHMFGLSLPPLIHDRMSAHMGPEPAYVERGRTGFVYSLDGGVDALAASLRDVWAVSPAQMRATAAAAYSKYEQLNTPSLGRRLAEIVRTTLEPETAV
ncbi:glycosyltransferase [Paraburkholderia sp.]|uniref:glycosyltransferase n=1 Tax=Paraburkholderia sp. TaxID=1926495 RepID=UPI0023829304|nr:glycosyltransferase [Paraburkholderia sp.]MDE1183021.1 glycosyltransferase [Paraburkholderia sp.]